MPTVIFVDHLDQVQTVQASEGGSLAQLCDEVDSPVPFHCRRATCGTCRVAIPEGIDELLPPERHELALLEVLGLSPRYYRLACQARMHPGPAVLRVQPLGKRTRRYSLSIPVTFDAASNQIRASDARAGELLVTGATDPWLGNVVLVTFHPPSEAKPRDIVGRIVGVEPTGDVDGGLRCYTMAIEFLEHDEILTTIFRRVPRASLPGR